MDLICLNKKYSTTRLLTTTKPIAESNSGDKSKTFLFLPPAGRRKREGGLRTQGYFKTSLSNKPLITVITVVFNGAQYLEQTISSVINQSYDNVEYIIIDGCSNDGTLDIIKKYESAIDYWISEPDKGIYDAMNKGIIVTTGSWINFMNCGDYFYESNTIAAIFNDVNCSANSVLYGDHEVYYPSKKKKKIRKAGKLELLWQGSQFSHQSCFISTRLYQRNLLSLDYRIGADFHFIYNLSLNKETKFISMQKVLASVSAEGLSDRNRISVILEWWDIIRKAGKANNKVAFFYLVLITQEYIKSKVKFILSLTKYIVQKRNS